VVCDRQTVRPSGFCRQCGTLDIGSTVVVCYSQSVRPVSVASMEHLISEVLYQMIANWRRRLAKELQRVHEGGVMVDRGGDRVVLTSVQPPRGPAQLVSVRY